MDSNAPPSPKRGPRWSELGPLGKATRVAVFVFVSTYLTLAVARPLPKEHWLRTTVAPLAEKVQVARLSATWMMFVKEAQHSYVVLQFETDDGELYEVENFRWEGKSALQRIRDHRLRRMQRKLRNKGHRRKWGRHYMSYVCETVMREQIEVSTIEIIRKQPMILDDAGNLKSREFGRAVAFYDCHTKRLREVQ